MKRALASSLLVLAACPGTIDDPSRFYESAERDPEPAVADASADASADANVVEAGVTDANAPTTAIDASTWDAQVVRDAGWREASVDAAPAVDAGSCNFRQLVMSKCGNASCHGAGGAAAGLDLLSDGLAARLGDEHAGGACADFPLIDREQPQNSALYRKLTDTACGPRMPLGGALSLAEQQCVLGWIEAL